ncbi:MAG: homoserine kinase [Thermoanaerobacteraceae bacterium]|nr:homoserine kinase [Thermoanaerobacteraceae bacterium]
MERAAMVRVRVPATTANMGPGFDTIGMALKLYNYLEMEEISGGLQIEITGEEDSGDIPRDERNIVYQAAERVFAKTGYRPAGLTIRQEINIPAARGMGSSAAAIVGGLIAANWLSGNKLSADELLHMAVAMEGHPDNVAPAMLGGVVVSALMDEKLFYRYIAPPEDLELVVAVPEFQLSTRVARDILPLNVPVQDAVFNVSRASLLVLALVQKDYELLGQMMDDKLHQPYRLNLVPGMQDVFAAARDNGALAVALSGAGPTLIAFVKDKDKLRDVGDSMRQAFLQAGVTCSIKYLSACPAGAEVELEGEWVTCL